MLNEPKTLGSNSEFRGPAVKFLHQLMCVHFDNILSSKDINEENCICADVYIYIYRYDDVGGGDDDDIVIVSLSADSNGLE